MLAVDKHVQVLRRPKPLGRIGPVGLRLLAGGRNRFVSASGMTSKVAIRAYMALLSSVGYASALTLPLIEIYPQSMPTPAAGPRINAERPASAGLSP